MEHGLSYKNLGPHNNGVLSPTNVARRLMGSAPFDLFLLGSRHDLNFYMLFFEVVCILQKYAFNLEC